MKNLIELISQYPSYYAAGKVLGVNPQQLQRLVDKGAMYDDEGTVYIPSQTKLFTYHRKQN